MPSCLTYFIDALIVITELEDIFRYLPEKYRLPHSHDWVSPPASTCIVCEPKYKEVFQLKAD